MPGLRTVLITDKNNVNQDNSIYNTKKKEYCEITL